MDLNQYTIQELIIFATRYIRDRENKKGYVEKYRKTEKGKIATRRSALKYYYKKKALLSK